MAARARGDLNLWWRMGVPLVGALFRAFFRLRFVGLEHVPVRGPAILACNHVSSLDGIVLALATAERRRRMTRFLVAAEFFRRARVAWALRLYRQIPLRRGRGDAVALDEAVRTIRDGALAGIFPEGKVNPEPEGGLQRGRTGVGRIALASGAPVVPVGVWGTQERWPRQGLHLRRPFRRSVALVYGEAISPKGDAASIVDVQAFTDLVMTAITKRVAEARAAKGA